MKRKLVYFVLITIGMVSLLYLMDKTYSEVQKDSTKANPSLSSYVWMSVLFFLYGLLIEWRALFNLIRAQMHVRWGLLIVAVILAVITFIPSLYWVQWFGLGRPFYIGILWK